jgi:hypothetical protein
MGHFDGAPLAVEPLVLPTTLVVRGSTVAQAP